jgi:ABC-2 type transport system permease protein
MTSGFSVQVEAVKASLYSRMAYRGDFFISISLTFIFEFITPLVTLLIYSNGSSFPGWTLYQVLLIQGVFMMSKGIAFMFFYGLVGNVLGGVQSGTFDMFLLRPRPVLFMAIATGFDSEELGKFIGGLILFIVALIHLPTPSFIQWIQFILLMITSLLVMFSFSLISSGVVFVWVGCSRVYEIFDSISSFGIYPRTIFSKGIQNIITFIVPIVMIGFFPASILLGKNINGVLFGVISSISFVLLSLCFWYWMLSKYTSAGG